MLRWSVILLLLAGCAAPSPYFAGRPATRVEVGGSVFNVRVRGLLAEATRVNAQYAPRFGPVRQRAAAAMAQVSGCPVLDVIGDAAVALGILGCDRERAERLLDLARARVRYDCIDVSAWVNEGPGPDYAEFECSPY